MVYLLIGDDGEKKDSQLAQIRKQTLKTQDSTHFDYDVLYANKLDAQDLKKGLGTLPFIAPARLVIVRDCHKLTTQNKKILEDFLSTQSQHLVLVLESSAWTLSDAFVKLIKPHAQIIDLFKKQPVSVFDLTKAMGSRRLPEALQMLSELFQEGSHPLQIMGGLVWFWGNKCKQRLNPSQFAQGLQTLSQADLNIKRSRLKPEQAMEVCVTKLSGLLEPHF